jgi:hypothetical protein
MGRLGALTLIGYIIMVAAIDSLPGAAILAIGAALCVVCAVVMVRSAVQR